MFNINLANSTHSNFYNYDKVDYINNYSKIEIICPVHGSFLQSPYQHLNLKRGCRKCQYQKLSGKFSFNTNQFINLAKNIHGERYDYSNVQYLNSRKKISIICKEHGIFHQSSEKHLKGQGCPNCKNKKLSILKRDSLSNFIEKSKKIHGSKYCYDLVNYVNAHTKIIVICNKHGEFLIKPSNHIFNANGCPSCGYNISKQEEEWLDNLNINKEDRQKILVINGKKFKVDAYTESNRTIYEFYGYFWHGHPDFFNPEEINPKNKIKFGDSYRLTIERINLFQSNGYNVVYKWG